MPGCRRGPRLGALRLCRRPRAGRDPREGGQHRRKRGIKLLVLPYQPILRSVPQTKVKQATDVLTKELSNTDGLSVMQGGVATTQDNGASLAAAEGLVKQAYEAEKSKNIGAAITHWKGAIASTRRTRRRSKTSSLTSKRITASPGR